MIKRDKNFRLPKYVKTQLALMKDRSKVSEYKNLMIEAIVSGSIIIKEKKKKETIKED